MRKNAALALIAACLLAAGVLVGLLFRQTKNDASALRTLAQSEAEEARARFSDFLEKGEESDYWGGVSAFYAFARAYALWTAEEEDKLADRLVCSEVYGSLLLHPEEVKAQLAKLIDVLTILSKDVTARSGYAGMEALNNALER